MEANQLYTIKKMAEILTLRPLTVYRLVSRGQLPAVRIGRSIRFDPEAIAAYLKKNQVEIKNGKEK